MDRSAKPQLNEIGPYVYKENRIKYDIKPNPDNDTVIYRQNITYTFVREMSVGPDTDVFNIVNVPFFVRNRNFGMIFKQSKKKITNFLVCRSSIGNSEKFVRHNAIIAETAGRTLIKGKVG